MVVMGSATTTRARIAHRLGDVPGFLAYEFRNWREITGRDVESELTVPVESVDRLAVCRRPRPGSYPTDLRALAGYGRVDPVRLANLLRAAESLTVLQAMPRGFGASRALMAARDETADRPNLDPGVAGAPLLPTWLHDAVARFWGPEGPSASFPVDLHLPVLTNLPVAIIEITNLTVAELQEWLARHQIPARDAIGDRVLRGCLLAYAGVGLIFVDAADSETERRLTLAHEAAHFIVDYLVPRETIARTRPDLLEVFDDERSPTRGDRLGALISDVPLGVHTHLLERHADGRFVDVHASSAEQRVDQLAMELVAPVAQALRLAESTPSHELVTVLMERFGLPHPAAHQYAVHLRRLRPAPARNLLDAIGLGDHNETGDGPDRGGR
jgi:hypothetical protein